MECRTVSGERTGGFTLIELLVVMVIIASLLTIATPRYFRSIEHSKEVLLAQDLAIMRDALDKFYGDTGQYPETLQELADKRYIRSVPVDPITKSADSWIAVQSSDPDVTGIADVHSGAERLSSNGTPFNEW
jgi:general secretion pathway protein G